MGTDEQFCYVYIQLAGMLETVPCASLRIRSVGAGTYEGTFVYGKKYLRRPNVAALDPFHLPLSARPQKFTKLKGIPGAVRDASPDAWGRRVIQAKLQRPEADIQEMEYLLNGPDDGAGVGRRDVLMLERFDREWNPDEKAYWRYGLVSGLTVLDAEDGYPGRDSWSYLLLADELRRWSAKSNQDRRELFGRMVFNAMVTNDDDHPRNHALLHTSGGWRLSPAYDILPVPKVAVERRDLALEVGRYGRAASLYNLFSQCEAFELDKDEAQAIVESMLAVVRTWREFFIERGVEQRSIEMLEQAILPPSFFRDTPPEPI